MRWMIVPVAACGGGDDEDVPTDAPASSTTAAPTPATSPTAAETPDETATPGGDGSNSTTTRTSDDLDAVLDGFCQISDNEALLARDLVVARPPPDSASAVSPPQMAPDFRSLSEI